jgi:uncharacterized protein involved in exopolysaccharide biosynthesis
MSNELIASSRSTLSPTPRELAAMLFRRPRLVAASFAFLLLATMLFVVFSARYESHFMVLLRRGRYDPVASSQPASPMDFTRPDITEEELNSEVELLRDEDMLKQVVKLAGIVPAETADSERPAEIEHAVRKLSRRLDVEALKKSNLIQVGYKDTSAERAARVLAALSTLYVQRHTSLQRPPGEIQFFDQQTAAYEKRLHQSESELVQFTRSRGVASAALQRDIALQKLGEADAAYRQIDQDRVETEHRIASLGEQLKSFPARSVTLKRWADNPEVLEKMKTHLLELQLNRTELLTRFEPSYRLVQEVEKEIADDGQVRADERRHFAASSQHDGRNRRESDTCADANPGTPATSHRRSIHGVSVGGGRFAGTRGSVQRAGTLQSGLGLAVGFAANFCGSGHAFRILGGTLQERRRSVSGRDCANPGEVNFVRSWAGPQRAVGRNAAARGLHDICRQSDRPGGMAPIEADGIEAATARN